MAYVAGKDAYLTVNLLNIGSALSNEFTFSGETDEIDASTIGGNYKQWLQGQTAYTLTIGGVWDNGTATTNLDSVLSTMQGASAGTKLYEFMPGGSASAKILYKGNCFLTKYEISGSNTDKVAFSAAFRISDTPTRSITA